ncbi:MAG TPA: hypothetical protein VFN35_11240, partial [Ktedonobacteraceae bacterium]|nr:hypothetical protein [Ktedonobacteraceae bacterium]
PQMLRQTLGPGATWAQVQASSDWPSHPASQEQMASEEKARFRLPFYAEDTPLEVPGRPVQSANPLPVANGLALDQPPPLRRQLPVSWRALLLGLIILVVLGSSVLLFQNISHAFTSSPPGANSTQNGLTSHQGQAQTPTSGVSTPAGHSTQIALPGADPVAGGKKSTPGTSTATPTPTSVPRPTPTSKPAPAPTPKPVSTLPPPPGGSALTSTSFPTAKWWVSTFGTAPGYRGGWTRVGSLYANTNYVFCKAWGAQTSDSKGNYNHWWMWTDLDTGGQGWVSAYYLSKWGNDEARDNSGQVLPNC